MRAASKAELISATTGSARLQHPAGQVRQHAPVGGVTGPALPASPAPAGWRCSRWCRRGCPVRCRGRARGRTTSASGESRRWSRRPSGDVREADSAATVSALRPDSLSRRRRRPAGRRRRPAARRPRRRTRAGPGARQTGAALRAACSLAPMPTSAITSPVRGAGTSGSASRRRLGAAGQHVGLCGDAVGETHVVNLSLRRRSGRRRCSAGTAARAARAAPPRGRRRRRCRPKSEEYLPVNSAIATGIVLALVVEVKIRA